MYTYIKQSIIMDSGVCTAVRRYAQQYIRLSQGFCAATFFPEILCPEPNALRNGEYTYLTSPATPRVGSVVQYSCTNNPPVFRLVGA